MSNETRTCYNGIGGNNLVDDTFTQKKLHFVVVQRCDLSVTNVADTRRARI